MDTAWHVEAERKAMRCLADMVTPRAMACYELTGMFLETSHRSKVTYVFRRSRPTLAMGRSKEDGIRLLAALCLHPIGHYRGSYGGCMVPTDDVIAHLVLMRGDEHAFWKRSNHHDILTPQSGV